MSRETSQGAGVKPNLSEGYRKLGVLVDSPFLSAAELVGQENFGKVKTVSDMGIVRSRMVLGIEVLADVLHNLTVFIEERPDLEKDQLFGQLNNSPLVDKLTGHQVEAAKHVLSLYADQRRQMMAVRGSFADNELYQALFKRSPRGRVGISLLSTVLYLSCSNSHDYAFAFHRKEFGEPTTQELEKANRSGGCCLSSPTIVALPTGKKQEVNVALENAAGYLPDEDRSEYVRVHEQQHSRWNLITQALIKYYEEWVASGVSRLSASSAWEWDISDISKIEGYPARRRHLLSFLRDIRSKAVIDAQDEFLAYLVNRTDPNEISALLLRPEEKRGLYDYFPGVRREEIKNEVWIKWRGANGWQEAEEATDKVFVSEYQQLIHQAADGVLDLLRLGYSYQRIMELFTFVHLEHWKKTALRFEEAGRSERQRVLAERRAKLGLEGSLSQILDSLLAATVIANPKKSGVLSSFQRSLEGLYAPEVLEAGSAEVETHISFREDELSEKIFKGLGVVDEDIEWVTHMNRVMDPLLDRAGRQQGTVSFDTAIEGLSITAAPRQKPWGACTFSLRFDNRALNSLIALPVHKSLFRKEVRSINRTVRRLRSRLAELETLERETPIYITVNKYLGLKKEKVRNPEYSPLLDQINVTRALLRKYL